jgi:hypothetical protein
LGVRGGSGGINLELLNSRRNLARKVAEEGKSIRSNLDAYRKCAIFVASTVKRYTADEVAVLSEYRWFGSRLGMVEGFTRKEPKSVH